MLKGGFQFEQTTSLCKIHRIFIAPQKTPAFSHRDCHAEIKNYKFWTTV